MVFLTDRVDLRRGVRQGDSLSRILANVSLYFSIDHNRIFNFMTRDLSNVAPVCLLLRHWGECDAAPS